MEQQKKSRNGFEKFLFLKKLFFSMLTKNILFSENRSDKNTTTNQQCVLEKLN